MALKKVLWTYFGVYLSQNIYQEVLGVSARKSCGSFTFHTFGEYGDSGDFGDSCDSGEFGDSGKSADSG